MPRPPITEWDKRLFRKQLNETLDWIEANSGGTPAWGDVTGKPTEFPPEAHTHVIDDVTGLQTALDNAGGGNPALAWVI